MGRRPAPVRGGHSAHRVTPDTRTVVHDTTTHVRPFSDNQCHPVERSHQQRLGGDTAALVAPHEDRRAKASCGE